MILDQQIGAHAAQVEYVGLGWGYSWVSGEGETAVAVTGPYFFAALATHDPGAQATATHDPGGQSLHSI